jgi:ABC-type branched-subunit amino acid transport system substrate-binding protein
MLDVLKAKKIAVIHDKDTYGQGLADATARRWRSGVKKCCTKAFPAVKKTLTPW